MPALSLEDITTTTEESFLIGTENRVKLNVGGQIFVTTRSTLMRYRDSMLASIVSGLFTMEKDPEGAFFIDRDPTNFRHILNFLRDGSVDVEGNTIAQNRALLREARFFQVKGLVCLLEELVKRASAKRKSELSDEKVYKFMPNVETSKLNEIFMNMTLIDGYDFENWLPGDKGKCNVLFSKKLSRGELMLLERLESNM